MLFRALLARDQGESRVAKEGESAAAGEIRLIVGQFINSIYRENMDFIINGKVLQ